MSLTAEDPAWLSRVLRYFRNYPRQNTIRDGLDSVQSLDKEQGNRI